MQTTKETRQSNMECVRIIAMSIIVIGHFIIHGGVFTAYPQSRYAVPLLTWGVDLFIMISGYYLIKFRLSSLIKLLTTLVGFALILAVVAVLWPAAEGISVKKLILLFVAPVSKSGLWFVQIYVGLMMLSPLINTALKSFCLRDLRRCMILLTVFEVYSCWLLGNKLDISGFSLFNFIYIYILGYYLHVESWLNRLSISQLVTIAILCMIVNLTLNAGIIRFTGLLETDDYVDAVMQLGGKYSNPFTIIFCACIIVGFSRKVFYSKFINSFAEASFGVYLLQEGLLRATIYAYQGSMLQISSTAFIVTCIIVYCCYWCASWVITQGCDTVAKSIICIAEKYASKCNFSIHAQIPNQKGKKSQN